MKKLRDVASPGLIFLSLALLAGCGGQSPAATSAAVASGPPSASPSPTPTATPANPNAKTIPDIQKLAGWKNCTVCTGSALAVYSLTQGIVSPSLSGSSARFQLLTGTQPFGAALWFKFLGAQNGATHFVYDLFFLVDNPDAAQALEFNVVQSAGGNRYNFATQLDLAGQNTWRVWDPVGQHWVASAVHSTQLVANTWYHLVWEFERDADDNVVFTAVTLNGTRGVVNLSMPHTADSSSGVDVAFQADANLAATPYSVWLDKVSLTFW
jgi:hypothetical protein